MKISKESSGINLVDSENSIYIWIFRVVSLFSYQGSLLSHFASAINIISNHFCFVKTFLKLFLFCCSVFTASARYILSDGDTFVNTFFHFLQKSFFRLLLPCKESTFMRIIHQLTNGEGGIWTLAPLLTTYSLSRGAPSASLGTSPNCPRFVVSQKRLSSHSRVFI